MLFKNECGVFTSVRQGTAKLWSCSQEDSLRKQSSQVRIVQGKRYFLHSKSKKTSKSQVGK